MIFHFHKWSLWEEFAKTDVVRPFTGGVIGYAFIQKRVCKTCGLTQYNEQRIMARE